MDDIGREPDDGRANDVAFQCPCGSWNTTLPNQNNECRCLDCGESFAVGPDPYDYPDD